MTVILELSYFGFKITTINMLRAIIEKVDNMEEHMTSVRRAMETKNLQKMLEFKNTVTNINNACDRLISRFYTSQEKSVSLKISP